LIISIVEIVIFLSNICFYSLFKCTFTLTGAACDISPVSVCELYGGDPITCLPSLTTGDG